MKATAGGAFGYIGRRRGPMVGQNDAVNAGGDPLDLDR